MRILVIGLGTIGGFFSTLISEFDELTNISIIDYDKVEPKNLLNTVFRRKHVGMYKVDAVEEIIKETTENITLSKYNEQFKEEEFDLTQFDYTVDCRDFTYNRENIDIRLYFSGRQLIVDCRKSTKYKSPMEGHYISTLTKNDVIGSVNAVTLLFRNKIIDKFIKDQVVWRYELDNSNMQACKYIDQRSQLPDILYESNYMNDKGEDSLINLHENIQPILDMNRSNDIKLFVGPKEYPTIIKDFPTGSLSSFSDVITSLVNAINLPFCYNYYIVSSGNNFVELIPETGAA